MDSVVAVCVCVCAHAQSRRALCSPIDCSLQLLCPWDFRGKNTEVEWVAIFFSRGSSRPASLESPALAGGFVTTDTTWEAQKSLGMLLSFVTLYRGHISENFP